MMISRLRPGSIVVPWDFSSESEAELEAALKLVDDPTMVRVVHVAPSDSSGAVMVCDGSHARVYREMRLKFQQQLRDNPICRETMFYVVFGNVAQEIASFARHYRAALIVMGTRDHWAITRFLRGSVTLEVIRIAQCPLLILPNDNQEKSHQLNVQQVQSLSRDRSM